METNASSKKVLDESFSKKEVTFCDKSSVLFYAVEEAVDSLNDSVIHTISNDKFPLLPEFSNMLQSYSTDSDSKYSSDLGNLPKAIVVLEKLPEALVHEHTCSDSVTECCLMANVPQNTDKVCSLKSGLSHLKKITEPVMNQISPILKKNKYPIRNLTVSIPQLPFKEIVSGNYTAVDSYSENSSGEASTLNMIANNVKTRSRNKSGGHLDQNLDSIRQSSLHNSFDKMPSSRETETSKFLGKNCTEGKENIKIVDSDASTCIVSQVNGSEVSSGEASTLNMIANNVKTRSRNKSGRHLDQNLDSIQQSSLQNSFVKMPSSRETETSKFLGKNCTEGKENIKIVDSDASTCIVSQVNGSEVSSGEASTLNMIANNVKTRSRNKSGRHLDQNLDSIQQSSLQNSFVKMPSSRETETSKFLGKNCTEGKENIKIVDSDASTCIVSQVNGSEVSFDKYPCIHLEKLNLGPYLYDISSSSESKKDVPMDSELEVGSTMNASGLSMTEKTLPVTEEVSPNTVSFSPPVIDVEDDSTSSDAIFSEESHCTRSILKDLLTNNEVSSDSVLFDHKNSPKDISSLQTESIVEDTNLNNSVPYKNAQNKFPIVLLERLNLPFSESDINYMDFTESPCINSVPTVTNVPDLPIQIENVCSISTENFNKIHKRQKKSSNHSFVDPFNESELNIINPKSNHASSFNISESSSESMVVDNTSGPSIFKPKSNVSSFNSSESSSESMIADNFISGSDDSSSENDLPLIMLSKQKLNLSLSFNQSEDSSSDDISLISPNSDASLTVPTKPKNSLTKSHKHKKKNSIHVSAGCSSVMKKKGSKSQMTRDISKKKCNKFVQSLPPEKKKSSKNKKSLRKKQRKVYKMITKYLKMQMKSKKHKKKSKKRKNLKSVNFVPSNNLVPSSNGSDTESTLSSDSIALMNDSVERDHSYAQNKNSFQENGKTSVQSKKVCHGESSSALENIREHSYAQSENSFQKRDKTSKKACNCAYCGPTSTPKKDTKPKKATTPKKGCNCVYCGPTSTPKKDTKAKKRQKSVDKYRLGFLSNKLSLRFYNRFFASERLLFSKCKLKKNKKKELKRLFTRLKAVGLMSLK